MSFRILMPLLTYPDAAPASAAPRALDFAATLGAHVTAVVHEVDIPPLHNPVAELLLDLQAKSDAAEALSRSRAADLGRELVHLSERLGLPLTVERLRTQRPCGEIVAATARSYDLSMLVCLPESPDHQLLQEEMIFGSGGPVVVFPTVDAPSHIQTVAIAWDGSRAAARAIRDALPVLALARQVCLLTCTQDKPITPQSIDGIVRILASHGIEARHVPIGLDADIGTALQKGALALDAGLLVMGAYGHSRMREFIMGGATTSVLQSPRLPLFMSH
jgi:nucleotide-binding universal stress UspA family protein